MKDSCFEESREENCLASTGMSAREERQDSDWQNKEGKRKLTGKPLRVKLWALLLKFFVFLNEEIKAQRSEVTCPRLYSLDLPKENV